MKNLYKISFIMFSLFLMISTLLPQDHKKQRYEGSFTEAPAINLTTALGSSSDDVNAFYEEGFESTTFPPVGWKTVNVLGTVVWTRSTSVPHTGLADAFCNYQGTGGEDWLITPKWNIGAGDSIKFWARKVFTTVYEPDTLYVYTSTDTALASFTNLIMKFSVNTLSSITTYDLKAASLSSVAGQQVYIAFKHADLDGNGVYIDDLSVGTPPPNDVGVFSVDTPPSSVPGPIIPLATIRNFGSAAQTFTVTMTITPGAYSSTKTVTSLTPATNQQVTFDSWTAAVGSYTVKVKTNLAGDVNTSNDSLLKSINISSSTWTTGATIPVTTYFGGGTTYTRNDTAWFFSIGGNTVPATGDLGVKYNVNTNTYTAIANLPAGRRVLGIATCKDSVYIFGGSDMSSVYQNTIYRYSINSNSWVQKVNLPTIRGWVAATGYQDSLIYVAGGFDGTNYLSDVVLYNTVTNTYRMATPMPGAVFGGGFTVWNNTLVYVAGAAASGIVANVYYGTISQADRSVITWTTGAPFPGGVRYRLQACSWGNYGVIAGAGSATSAFTDVWKDFYVFNPTSNTWSPAPDKITAVLGASYGSVRYNNGLLKLIVASGYTGTANFSGTEIFIDTDVPVELKSFAGSVIDGKVNLNWSTATETNNYGFDIERKAEGQEFTKVGFVAGFGTTSEVKSYNFVDNSVTSGSYTYRLKQVDFDGTFEYSDEVEVTFAPTTYSLVQNYPNPFNPTTKIDFALASDSKVTLKIFDILGQEVTTLLNGNLSAGIHTHNFDASGINSGVYFYTLEATGVDGSNFTSTKKMILTK